MHEQFTDRVKKVMQQANQEAVRLNHEYMVLSMFFWDFSTKPPAWRPP
jgi:hypothetical protein